MPTFNHRDFKWPTMRTAIVRLRHMPDIMVDASVSLDTGKPIVDFRIVRRATVTLTPDEACRVAHALLKAVDCCRAKSAAAKAWRSSPVREESKPLRTLPARKEVRRE